MALNKLLEATEESDLQALVDNQVSERKTIEYKEALPGNADGDKKEFLADVSSFANASGGDLIYGLREQSGVPIELSGLELSDVDAEILRLESCIQTGIAPRLFRIVETHPVALPSKQRYAIIIRIRKSWTAPHMVTFKNDSKFFSRDSRGKHQLDVSELRSAFLLLETAAERIRNFRTERLMRIGAGEETPAPLDEQAPKLVLHIIPFNSFSTSVPLDLKPLNDSVKGQLLEPLMVWDSASNVNMRFNIDGIVRSVREMNSPSTIAYTQVFRNGIIETVDMSILGINARNVSQFGSNVEPRSFSGEVYERKLLATVKRYIDLQKFLDIDPDTIPKVV